MINKCYDKTGLLRIEVEPYCIVPNLYGVAYINYNNGKQVCYPLIINWAVWFFREIYFKIKYTPTTNKLFYKNKILVGYFTDYNKSYFDIICVGFDHKIVAEKLNENASATGRKDLAEICISDLIL